MGQEVLRRPWGGRPRSWRFDAADSVQNDRNQDLQNVDCQLAPGPWRSIAQFCSLREEGITAGGERGFGWGLVVGY